MQLDPFFDALNDGDNFCISFITAMGIFDCFLKLIVSALLATFFLDEMLVSSLTV